MRDFIFVKNEEPKNQAVLRTDIIDDEFDKFTVMWCEGVKGTEFEKIIPWKCGTVISKKDVEEFALKYQSILTVVKYGSEQVEVIGAPTHIITITATITTSPSIEVVLKGTKKGAIDINDKVTLETTVPKKLKGIEGYTYQIILPEDASWADGDPGEWECTGDKEITKSINYSPA